MKLKGIQTHQLLAALGATLAAVLLAGPAAARPADDGVILNQRQLELASDRYHDQATVAGSLRERPDGYQPQLGLSAGNPTSLRDRPDGYQPQLGVAEVSAVADDGFDWTTTGFAASIIAAMLVALTATFTYGNRRGYRSA